MPHILQKIEGKMVFFKDNSAIHKSKKSMKVVEELVGNRLIEHRPVSPECD